MIELDDDTLQDIREGALPGVRFYRDSWDQELLFAAPDTLEEFRGLERRQVERQEAVVDPVDPPQPAPVEPARRRTRRPTLASAVREASKAGLHVAGAAVDPITGKITLTFGAPGAATSSGNPWDEVLSHEPH